LSSTPRPRWRSSSTPGLAGALAHADLLALCVDLFPYEPFATRVWELRGNLTAYEAWYVTDIFLGAVMPGRSTHSTPTGCRRCG
jgi:hypothetical protein